MNWLDQFIKHVIYFESGLSWETNWKMPFPFSLISGYTNAILVFVKKITSTVGNPWSKIPKCCLDLRCVLGFTRTHWLAVTRQRHASASPSRVPSKLVKREFLTRRSLSLYLATIVHTHTHAELGFPTPFPVFHQLSFFDLYGMKDSTSDDWNVHRLPSSIYISIFFVFSFIGLENVYHWQPSGCRIRWFSSKTPFRQPFERKCAVVRRFQSLTRKSPIRYVSSGNVIFHRKW